MKRFWPSATLRQISRRIPDDFDELPEDEQQDILQEIENVVLSVNTDDLEEEIFRSGKLISRLTNWKPAKIESKLIELKSELLSKGFSAIQR